MFHEYDKILNRLYFIMDSILIFFSLSLSYLLYFKSDLLRYVTTMYYGKETSINYYSFSIYLELSVLLIPSYIIICLFAHRYSTTRKKRHPFLDIIINNVLVILCLAFIIFITKKQFKDISRIIIGLFCILNSILNLLIHYVLQNLLDRHYEKPQNCRHCLLVGYSKSCEAFIERMIEHPRQGYEIDGILDNHMVAGTTFKSIKVLGEIPMLKEILDRNEIDEIIITLSINEYNELGDLVSECEKSGVHTVFIPDYYKIIPTTPYTEDLGGLPVINIRRVPLTNPLNQFLKRSFDLIGASVILILVSPLMLLTALAVKLSSKGPIFFTQTRVGIHNREFKMYKFRSMVVQNSEKEKKAWTTKMDSRVTPIGKFIRKTSIDEFPQLFNVIKGDMSLVGPRPERPYFVDKFKEEIPHYMVKHQVRPGMTGWAQVKGYRGDTSIVKRIDHDLYYIEHWTWATDIKILFMTVFTGFINKNAY